MIYFSLGISSFLLLPGPSCPRLFFLPFWLIFKKAGFSPWLSLLTLVPLAKYIVLWIVAFSEWKAGPAQRS